MFSFSSCRVRRLTLIFSVILAAFIGCMASATGGTDAWYLSLNKSQLRSYQFFCLEHIKEFNKSWNFHEGYESDFLEEEINHFIAIEIFLSGLIGVGI